MSRTGPAHWPLPGRAERPMVVLTKTVKGKFPEVEDKNGWHGRPLPAAAAARALVTG